MTTTTEWPKADVSEENIARLVAEVPDALVSAFAKAAAEARAVAFYAEAMIGRYHDLQTALGVVVEQRLRKRCGPRERHHGPDRPTGRVGGDARHRRRVNEESARAAAQLRVHARAYEETVGFGPKSLV